MITRLVMAAFDRFAIGESLLDIARSVIDSPNPTQTDRFMQEAFRLDSTISAAFAEAMLDDETSPPKEGEATREEMFRHVFEQMLEGIASGETSSAKAVAEENVAKLMNTIRMLLQNTLEGNDRETKSVGMRDKLKEFGTALSKVETRDSAAKDVSAFVEDVFSGEIGWLVRTYWWSRDRTTGQLKSILLTQDAGGKEKALELAKMTIFGLLLDGTWNSIEKKLYDQKPNDAAVLGAIAQGAWYRIRNRKTDDQYDGESAATSGGDSARAKWSTYIAPLQGTGKFGHGESLDILGITEFLNEYFVRLDLDSKTIINAPLPGGGTMAAPSFKMKLNSTDVHQWAAGSFPAISTDTTVGDGDNAQSIGEIIGAPDKPYEETEEGIVEWLEAPSERSPSKTNRDLAKENIRRWVDETMSRTKIAKTNKDIVRDILLVKMGLMSSGEERKEFLDRWLSKDIPKFRAEAISNDTWKDIGEPFKKLRKGDPGVKINSETGEIIKRTPGDEPPYIKDWKQQALVNKTTGEQFLGRSDVLKGIDQDNLEVVTKVHKAGDESLPQHMLNWIKYSQEDREADLNQALDVYGEQWFEQSVNEDVRKELEKSNETLAEAFQKFRPENIFKAVAKHPDSELVRAMGRVKPTVQLESGRMPFLVHPAIYPDIKRAIKKLGEVMVEESKKDDGALRYLSLKRVGRVANIDIESIILKAAVSLADAPEIPI